MKRLREFHLLKLLLFFHGMAVAILAAFYYTRGYRLWNMGLAVKIGGSVHVYPVRGASLLLPWNLLPHDVAWLALDAVVFGTLTICLTYWLTRDELRNEVTGRERLAEDKLQQATQRSAEAEHCIQAAVAQEQAAQVAERLAEDREFAAAQREAEAQAQIEGKDVEVKTMSQALTRLKREAKDMREEVKGLRVALSKRQEKE